MKDYKTITKQTSMKDAAEILKMNGIGTPYGWEIVIGMLLEDCDYIEVQGYSHGANFVLVKDENEQVIE